MPAHYYRPGDNCYLKACGINETEDTVEVNMVVMLDIGIGRYWFAPSWAEYPPNIDYYSVGDLEGGEIDCRWVLDEFIWPEGPGEAQGWIFWGALVDTAFTHIVGEIDKWEFGFGP
jgi:hypothetical protein